MVVEWRDKESDTIKQSGTQKDVQKSIRGKQG